MQCRFIIILLFVLSANEYCLFGQQNYLRFSSLTRNDGLSDDYVISLLQDKEGLIWIGTSYGLNCYDGNNIKTYVYDSQIPGTISDNSISDLYEDSQNAIWVGTSNGLNKFNKDLGTFRNFRHNKNDPNSLSNDNITKIIEDNNGNLFIGTRFGLNLYNQKEDQFIHFFHNENDSNSISNNNIYQVYKDHEGSVWIVTSSGLNRFDEVNHRFIKENEKGNNNKIQFTHYIGAMYDDSQNNLWYGTESGLYLVDKKIKNKIVYKRFLQNYTFEEFRDIVEDNRHNLWIATRSGLIQYNLINKTINKYVHDSFNEYSLTKNDICKLLFDKQGILWVGTYKGGVNFFNNLNNSIALYRNNPLDPTSLKNNFVLSFLEDADKDIWVGTDGGGLNKFDGVHGTFKAYTIDNSRISSNTILSLIQDKKGMIWIGSWNGGVCSFDKKTGAFKTYLSYHLSTGALNNPNVWSILEDRSENLWIGTMGGGLNKLDRKTGLFSHYTYEPANPDSSYTIDNEVWAMVQDKKGNIWVGSSRALNLFNPKTGHFKHFYRKDPNNNHLNEINILCIFEDKKGRLWIGTDYNGLNQLIGDHITNINTKEKVPARMIYGIEEDEHGFLWISTNQGIYKFNPDLNQSKNFDMVYGLQGNNFGQGAYLKSGNGLIYFGGPNGFNVFCPDSLRNNSFDPPIVLTDFQIFNKSVGVGVNSPLRKQINSSDVIKLSFRQSVFTIMFACLNYINPKKNQYAYKLEGFDPDWNYVGSKHEATYTNLDPGTYTFSVKAANNDGIWSTHIKSIKIIIEPPYWKTVWFRLLFIVFSLALLFGIFYERVKSIQSKNENLEKLVNKRTLELESRTKEIEDKNLLLLKQTESLNEINSVLEERQQHIEEQAEELKSQKEELVIHQEQLTQLNATKDKLFSIIAHDLRNPFQAIIGFSELLRKDIDNLPKDKISKFLELIYTSSLRGNDLLNNLLLWSMSQTGRMKYEPDFLNLSEIATETINLLETAAHQKNIMIELLIGDDVLVFADQNMLQTIFRNLISNAVKFTFENGKITINSRRTLANTIEISISDSGVGIPKENLNKLFHIDESVRTQGTSHETGTGLGLVLCKEFVEQNKGKIWVTSELDKGTTFYFTVPFSPETNP